MSTQIVQCLLVFNPLSTYTNKVSGLCIHCRLKKYTWHRSSQLSLFSGNHKDFKPRRQHLRWPWENCFWGGGLGKEPGYMEVCRKGQVTWVLKTRSLWRTRYIKGFSSLLCSGRCKYWAYWNHFFHMHLSYLGPNPAFWFFSSVRLLSHVQLFATLWIAAC